MIRILSPLVCVCVLAASLLAQSRGEWFRSEVWDGVGDVVTKSTSSKTNVEPGIQAEAFTAGNIVVCRIGNGSTALSSAAFPVFLDEYTPDGTLVSTVAMPTANSGGNYMLTLSGTNINECQITRSTDGRYILLPGYVQPVTTGSVSSASGGKVIARIDSAGTVNSSTITEVSTTNQIRAAASVDGSGIWAVGDSSGVFYTPFGALGAYTVVSSTSTINRAVNIFGGQLYVSSNSAGTFRIGAVGSGTPTTAGNTTANLPGMPISGIPVGFYMADLSAGVAGLDTLYVADDGTSTGSGGGGVKKYSLVSGAWTYNGTFPANGATIPATMFLGLTGSVTSGNTVTLFATRRTAAGSQLVKFVDSTGYNVAPTAVPTLLSTSATNTIYRGVALAPVAPASAPSVVTGSATNLTASSATLNATANPNGASTSGYFRFSTTNPGTCNDSFGTRMPASGGTALGSGTSSAAFSESISGLSAGTTYYYCAIAQNSIGTSFGSVASFTTSLPNLSINDVSLSEGDSGSIAFTFTVSLSAPAGPGGVTFDIATADGSAQSGSDYIAKSLTSQTIAPGGSTYQFTVSVNGDSAVESDESFFVNVTNVTGATVADGQGAGTITNDDASPLNLAVTKTADTNDGVCDADCSLREAIAEANLNNATDTITFDPVLVASPVTISLVGTRLDITDDVVITGPGAELLTVNANNLSQIFIVGNGVTADISGMSLTGGNASGEFTQGGAIYSAGNLTLSGVHIYGNYAPFGGAVSGNEVTGALNIINSTIANNTADDVGAIVAYGSVNLINTTVSGNTATDFVGAVYIWGGTGLMYSIKNSTITNNSARSDGGLWSDAPNLQIGGSIIAGNNASEGSIDIIASAGTSLGFNLIGVSGNATWFTAAGDQTGTPESPLNAQLAPLTNNSGPVPTHAFDNSGGLSPAIDKGKSFGATLDARGLPRTVDFSSITNPLGGDGTDIGAYEFQAPTAAPVAIMGRVLTAEGRPVSGAVVMLTGESGEGVRVVTNTFGYYRFEGVSGGAGYVLSVAAKRYSFRAVFVNADADVAGLDIYADR